MVTLKYEDLVNNTDVSAEIEQAYGPDGLGILTVSGVPDYERRRLRLLPQAQQLVSGWENEEDGKMRRTMELMRTLRYA